MSFQQDLERLQFQLEQGTIQPGSEVLNVKNHRKRIKDELRKAGDKILTDAVLMRLTELQQSLTASKGMIQVPDRVKLVGIKSKSPNAFVGARAFFWGDHRRFYVIINVVVDEDNMGVEVVTLDEELYSKTTGVLTLESIKDFLKWELLRIVRNYGLK